MLLLSVFRSPLVRVLAIGSVVVGCDPIGTAPWEQSAVTENERVELKAGASDDRPYSYSSSESSHTLVVEMGGFSAVSGKVRVVVKECGIDSVVDVSDVKGSVAVKGVCQKARLATASLSVHFENLDASPIALHESLTMIISNPNPESTADAPEGTWVSFVPK